MRVRVRVWYTDTHIHPTWWYLTFIIYLFDVSPFPFFYSCFTFMFLAFFISFPFPYSTSWNLRHQDVPSSFFSHLLYKWTVVLLCLLCLSLLFSLSSHRLQLSISYRSLSLLHTRAHFSLQFIYHPLSLSPFHFYPASKRSEEHFPAILIIWFNMNRVNYY